MKAHGVFVLLVIGLLGSWGCTPSFVYVPDPTVYVKKDLSPHEVSPRLAVLPFESPFYNPDSGMYTAKLFYQRLLARKEFREVFFSQETDWYIKGMSWMGKSELAREEGRVRQADYVLIGSIDYYLVGHTTRNAVTVTARLLEVATGETVYFATGYGSGKPGKTFLFLDYKSGEYTPSATSVLAAVVDNLIKDCFSKGFFGSLKTIISKASHQETGHDASEMTQS
jgi:TolB-like protein